MYSTTLLLHSWLRWAVLVLGFWAVARAFVGMMGRRAWSPADQTAGRWFTIALDVQIALGLTLYGLLSPITAQALADMGQAMRNPALRFWAVEHIAMMLVAVVLAHVGWARARRAPTEAARHRVAALFGTLALLAVIAAIPWPFTAESRPLLRF